MSGGANLQGLSEQEAAARLETFGPNVLQGRAATPAWRVLLRQFSGALILILLIAAMVALAVGETVDAIVILAIVALNGLLGFVQEWRAERTLEALRDMLTVQALVVRDGSETLIDARDIVPGDLLILRAGERTPADVKLLQVADLRIDESVLTGESASIAKTVGDDRDGRAFMGSNVVEGHGMGVVSATGMATEFGEVAALTTSVEQAPTHLQITLGRLGALLGAAATAIGALVVLVGWLGGRDIAVMALTGLSMAVAVVPEGLPAVVTVTLALGAQSMVRRNALSRRLQATETMGAASVICTDKTGTLTENRMAVAQVWTAVGRIDFEGVGYSPFGEVAQDGGEPTPAARAALEAVLIAAATCNNAQIVNRNGAWDPIGAPTEAALIAAATRAGVSAAPRSERRREIAFSSDRKRMTVLAAQGAGAVAYVKGAPEAILERCVAVAGGGALDKAFEVYEELARQGYRVLAVAERRDVDIGGAEEEIERDLTLLGLVGIIDPPRPEVKQAIRTAYEAGLEIVMITGDAPITALAIARMLDMRASVSVTGEEIEAMDDAALSRKLRERAVFARTTPRHKMRIVELLQKDGRIVAMTGDGVNDAPALKRADIGVAMGVRGTEVSKQAADLVLLDDNFASIVAAVEEGRRQYGNIKKFVRYMLASNAGEVIAITANIAIGGPLVLLPIQILWMNLVTDGVTALTLGLEKAEPDAMKRPPRAPDEDLVGTQGLAVILLFAAYTGSATLFAYYGALDAGLDVVSAQTLALTAMIVFQKCSVFAFRSFTQPSWRIGVASNPWLLAAVFGTLAVQALAVYWPPLQGVLGLEPLSASAWITIAALAAPLLIVPELVKWARLR